ncbi:3-carboxy-cis,cis-mucoante lactonizing enzyme [Acephala macrosclerotiorum]|nr:3-carboxy-cis,cis-mucoante lactonizing enzyme [Acephala macrosclerotiorum]
MLFHALGLGLLAALVRTGNAANIFASHYSGTIYSLTLTGSGSSYTLTQNSFVAVGGQPSWMMFNSTERTLYISDETGSGSEQVVSVAAATNGGLKLSGKASAPLGAVANVQYGGENYLASAHYQTSMITTHKLPLTSGASAFQTFTLTMSAKRPNSRQDAPHPHETIVDPTGEYILTPDLGADLVRIYKIDAASGKPTACTPYTDTPGTGPRHATFWGKNILYVRNELANSVHSFTVSYPLGGCLTLTKMQTLTTMPGGKAVPSGTKVGEVHVKDNFLYASNRRDLSFSPNDSMASFSLDASGMTFQGLTSSGGTYPRTFQINQAGDLVVIGNRTTANVVVVKRDVSTGLLGPQVAGMRIGSVGQAENDNGLSAVLWDE